MSIVDKSIVSMVLGPGQSLITGSQAISVQQGEHGEPIIIIHGKPSHSNGPELLHLQKSKRQDQRKNAPLAPARKPDQVGGVCIE